MNTKYQNVTFSHLACQMEASRPLDPRQLPHWSQTKRVQQVMCNLKKKIGFALFLQNQTVLALL